MNRSSNLSPPPPRRRLAVQLGPAMVARLVLNTSRRMLYIFAPAFGRGLGVPLTSITSLIAINQASGILGPLFGPLGDRWGYGLMMLVGLGAASVGLLAAGVLPFYAVVVMAVFLIGFAKSVFDPALQAYVGEQVPYHRRGLVMGLIELPWAGSALVGIPLVGLLISRIGWQSPFLVLGALGFLCLIMIGLVIPSDAQHQQRRPAGIRQAWRQLGQEPAALAALAFTFLITAANDTLFVVYGVWMESAFGLTVVALGASTIVIGVAELLGEGLTLSIADRVGLWRSVVFGLVLTGLSYLLLPVMARTLPLALAGLFFIFLTFEFTIVTSFSIFTEILPGARGTMMATNLAAASVGRMAGALVGGLVWMVGGLQAVSLVAAGASGLALVCMFWGLRAWRS